MKTVPKIIGIVGAIGSGKSAVAGMFGELGADVIDADKIAHKIIEKKRILAKLRKIWGNSIFAHGKLSREKLGEIVFKNKIQIKNLENVLHPLILKEMIRLIKISRKQAVLLDAPLLMESGNDKLCDIIIFVYTPRNIRLARIRTTRGWSTAELSRREKMQMRLNKKMQKADYIIRNDKAISNTYRNVKEVFHKVLNLN